ncbi:hypothetical protein SAMN04515680_0970 [Leifsonia sp. 21MFCrub1.1]|nr:hypothetical protein SAMN04515680_0970 [Leifsonia sp. 21MFCrub1.1]
MGRRSNRDSQQLLSWTAERVKHLEFLQATIARQASHSFAAKGWSLTVAAVIYGYTAANLSWWMALIALVPPVMFAKLDLFFLRQERLFRALYDDVRAPNSAVPIFEMSTLRYQNSAKYPACSPRSVRRSKPWRWLHFTVIGLGLLLLVVALFQMLSVQDLADRICGVIQHHG